MKSLKLTNIEIKLSWRACVSWVGEDGNRYHYWADRNNLQPLDDVLYKNPPPGVGYREPGYFDPRQLSISAAKNREAVLQVIAHCENEKLLDKAVADGVALLVGKIEESRRRDVDGQVFRYTRKMHAALEAIVAAHNARGDAGGEIIAATELMGELNAEIASLNREYDRHVAELTR